MFHIRTFYIHVIMAGWFYIVLLLIPQLQAQETATCNTPWNITFQNSLYVKWDGADRTVDVQITVKPDTGENKDDTTGCNEQSHLTSFNIKKLLIDPLCSNKTHWLEAGLICEDKRLVQIKKLTIQTDYVETPYNVTILGLFNCDCVSKGKLCAPPYYARLHQCTPAGKAMYNNQSVICLLEVEPELSNVPFAGLCGVLGLCPGASRSGNIPIGSHQMGKQMPSAPINLTEKHVTNTSITIEWDCPEFPNGPILDYVVQFLESPNGTLMEKNITENSTILENLKPYTLYTIRVAARTETGIGSFTEDLEVQTGVGVPGLPINISAVINATSIILDWDRPEIVPGILMDYQVTWGIRGTPTSLVVIDSNTHHYDAVGLRPYTDYHFEIAARTEAGAGIAETLAIRTGIAAPSSPRKLSVSEKHDSSIHLNWIPPEHPNGPDLIYRVEWIDMANNSAVMETNSTSCAVTSLNPSTNYSIAVMAMTRAAEGPWSESLSVTTNEKRHTRNPHFVLALVLGIMLPLLTILLIVGFIIAKRKGLFDDFRQRSRESSQEMVPQRPTIEMVSNEKIARSFTVHNFIQKVNTITRYGKSGFLQEFEELKRESSEHSTNAAKIEENLIKNRWVKILPFDHSRVKIYPDGTANRSNFINANYIPGENHIIEYIATQGPLPNTVNDFWTVVWQQSVPIVVMLTQCVERAVKNCEKYWPASGESKLYGDIRVQTKQETILTSHIMRVFLVQYQNQQRHIVQMHFTTWPVSGTPRNPVDFLHFIRLVREQVSDRRPGPILVHCSAGVGRTGTFIAVDRLMQHLQTNDEIDIYNTVLEMRRYRPHMVHTMEQYVFIYSCIQQLIQDSSEPQENIYDTVA
ncbi:Receptor-type tyrosine-protein phosphatase eta like protein [Argiope bruennichi]|uniref:protein-tyrosine-phosphatase n=1 Tax=Argiope bruennichi TaxID=94029 RepID=A0A8T0EJQ9_ARGBR|nr:Receptor-type tyrosine-protein phosphatase eta like protein [Argiope bruennichi]